MLRSDLLLVHLVEGTPSAIGRLLPRHTLVPLESGYPGYGGLHVLEGKDHVSVCKPSDTGDLAYTVVRDII